MKSKFAGVALVVLTSLTLAGCGDSASSSSGEGRSLSLTVSVASTNPLLATTAWGIASGIFEDAGVDIKLVVGGGTQAVNQLVANQADIAESSPASAGSLQANGKPTSIIWSSAGGGLGNIFVTGQKGAKTTEDFVDLAKSKGGCKIGVTSAGSTTYGYAKTFQKALGVSCELVSLGAQEQIQAAVIAGRVDATAVTKGFSGVSSAIAEGKLNVLIDTTDPAQVTDLNIPRITERILMGLDGKLRQESDAVERYLKGLNGVDQLIRSSSNAALAKLLLKLPEYSADYSGDEANLERAIESVRPFINFNAGYISDESWASTIATMKTWDIPDVDLDSDAFSYDQLVDMSYYDKSIGAPN
jgi:ABC-type nitrate/sulfonate/bicarbonate transport system substrate-binding protein